MSGSPRPASSCLRQRFDVDVDLDSDLTERIDAYDALIVRSATRVTADLLERSRPAQGDRPRRGRSRQRRHRGRDEARHPGRQRAGVHRSSRRPSTRSGCCSRSSARSPRRTPRCTRAAGSARVSRGLEVAEKTLGIVGFGRIGQQVARRARGLSMRVIAFDPYVAPERMREQGVEHAARLEDVLAASDFVSLHPALTAESKGLIGRRELELARDGIRIVNVARGELIDEEALVEALRSGKVAGAAIDTFVEEPYSGPLLELDERRADAASRRVDPGSPGSGGRDRRRAGGRRARGPAGLQRRQRTGNSGRGARVPGPLSAARREARRARLRARRRQRDSPRVRALR